MSERTLHLKEMPSQMCASAHIAYFGEKAGFSNFSLGVFLGSMCECMCMCVYVHVYFLW